AMLFGSVQEAARESKRMASEAGHPDPKVMCSYFVSVSHTTEETERARVRLLHYLHSILPVFPSDRRTAPPHIAYFVDIVERLRAMKADQVSDRSIVTGDVEHCIEVLKRCAEGGISEVILYFNFGELGHRDTLKAMERFAREVMPHFAERTQSVAEGRRSSASTSFRHSGRVTTRRRNTSPSVCAWPSAPTGSASTRSRPSSTTSTTTA